MRRAWLAMLLCTGLSACDLAPTYQAPDAAIPDRYADPDPAAAPGAAAQTLSWQHFFGDEQLKFLLARGLAFNQDLAAAVARIEQARAFYRIEQANRLPAVDAGAGAGRSQAPLSSLDPVFSDSRRTIQFNQYNVQVGISAFELDFWGRVRNLSEAARHQYLATVEGKRAFRLSLIANIAATYYAARAGEEGVELARRTIQTRSYALRVAKDRLDAGVTSLVDYEQAAILLTQAQTQLAELRRTTAEHWNQLWVLVGGKVEAAMPMARPIESAGQFENLDAGLPSFLLALRPDIRRAEDMLRSANANIGVARAAFFPRIALTGTYGYASPELSELLSSPSEIWTVGATLGLPIFDWGRRRAGLDLARAQRDEMVANYQKTVQTAFSEVATALERRARYREQLAAQAVAVRSQRRLAETADLRYQNGISIYLEVMDARRGLFDAEQRMLLLRAAQLQNGVSLYAALGGGDE